MDDLFQTTKQNISLYIQSIFKEGELTPEATHKNYLLVRREGNREVKRLLDYYNLAWKKLDTGKDQVYFIHQMLEAVCGISLMDI